MKSIITVLCLFGSHAYSQDALLIGGKPAKGGEFPASVYTSIGNSRCSATLAVLLDLYSLARVQTAE